MGGFQTGSRPVKSAALLACVALLASAQEPVIRVSVDLVQIDAGVTDSQGHHVADLKPEDFQVLEDGKPQKITHFSYVSGSANPLPAYAGAEWNPEFAQRLRPQDVRRTIVLVADDLSYGPAEFPRARTALKEFVDREMQPGDLVSIMTTSGGMGALEQLTNDKRALTAAIARIMFSPSRNLLNFVNGGDPPGNESQVYAAAAERAVAASRAPLFAAGSTSALGYAIQAMRDMAGRKAVVLFSAGFRGSTPALIEMANRSSVVVYTLDMRGIVATYDGHLPAGFWASQGSMDRLAQGTGGVFFHNTNGFGSALAAALEDISSYYLMGYQPQREDFDRVHGAPQFHKIQVKVLRAGLSVRSRDGFAGVADSPAVSRLDADGEFAQVLYSPFRGSALPVNLSASYSAKAEGGDKRGHVKTTLRALLVIDARGLPREDLPGGRQRLILDVLAGIWAESEKPVAIVDRRITVEKSAEEMGRDIEGGLALEVDVPVAKPGAYQLRSAVRQAGSPGAGSATAFVRIPDFNGRHIALSSVRLSQSVVLPGGALQYGCEIFGARPEKASGKPRIEVEVHLFRGPERIYSGHPIRLPVTTPEPPVRAEGQIRLPDFLPAGDYTVELTAYDRAAGERQQATQWVDFRLAAPR